MRKIIFCLLSFFSVSTLLSSELLVIDREINLGFFLRPNQPQRAFVEADGQGNVFVSQFGKDKFIKVGPAGNILLEGPIRIEGEIVRMDVDGEGNAICLFNGSKRYQGEERKSGLKENHFGQQRNPDDKRASQGSPFSVFPINLPAASPLFFRRNRLEGGEKGRHSFPVFPVLPGKEPFHFFFLLLYQRRIEKKKIAKEKDCNP